MCGVELVDQLIEKACKIRGSAYYLNAIYVYYESQLEECDLNEHNVKLKISQCINDDLEINYIDNPLEVLYRIYELTRKVDFTKKLFKANEFSIRYKEICCLLAYLDSNSLISLSLTCKDILDSVKCYLLRSLNDLPFYRLPISSNMDYWFNFIDYFFHQVGEIKPLDRLKYPLVADMLKANSQLFPTTLDGMVAHINITTDHLKPHFIVYCNHTNPQAHTCSSQLKIGGHNKATTKHISVSEFIEEYSTRLQIKSTCPFSKQRLCLLLKRWLECMIVAIEKSDGICNIKKTEYVVNPKHQLVHRIWIQIFCKWGIENDGDYNKSLKSNMDKTRNLKCNMDSTNSSNPNMDKEKRDSEDFDAQHSLYLTIADHFRWSS